MNLSRFLKNKPQHGCIGPCNSNMIRTGMCICNNPYNSSKKSKSPFFQYQFWMLVVIGLFILSLFINVDAFIGIGLIAVVFIYFKYFKK